GDERVAEVDRQALRRERRLERLLLRGFEGGLQPGKNISRSRRYACQTNQARECEERESHWLEKRIAAASERSKRAGNGFRRRAPPDKIATLFHCMGLWFCATIEYEAAPWPGPS